MKIIMILLDGLGDRSLETLGGQTPLQTALTPNLDRLADMGANGLYHPSLSGEGLPSELAHYQLFGFSREDFPGRGPLEALGYEVPFSPHDVVSLAHLTCCSIRQGIPRILCRRTEVDASYQEMESLFAPLTSFETHGIGFTLHQTGQNNAVLVLRGPVSPYLSDADPMIPGLPIAQVVPWAESPEPERSLNTTDAVNSYLQHCHRVLCRHPVNRDRKARGLPPVNFLVTLRAGRIKNHPGFSERWGLKGLSIASGAVYGGLARAVGLAFRRARDTTDPGEDLRERIRWALSDDRHAFIHVHTKAPDEAAHTGDPLRKVRVIQWLDKAMEEVVKALKVSKNTLFVVASDHSTPSLSTLIHSGEPVPIIMVGPGIRRDGVKHFDEIHAAKGCLGFLRGKELMLTALNFADRTCLRGQRLGPRGMAYLPTNYTPLSVSDSET